MPRCGAVLSLVLLSAFARVVAALPDLTAEIYDVSVQSGQSVGAGDVTEGCAGSTDGRTLVRFGVRSHNVGADPIVLGDPGCPDCMTNPGAVCQNPDFICSPAQGHDHPHFLDFARYELLDIAGTPVARGTKASFCLLDSGCVDSASPVFTDCSYQGISPGCYDDYHPELGCQYIDVTDVPDATTRAFRVRVTIDPDDLLPDADRSNNATEVIVPGCGDGVFQAGEDCDPGVPGAACCDARCHVQPAGRSCREPTAPCSAPAACDGASAECPPEQPLADGTPCGTDTGPCLVSMCRRGECVTERGAGCVIDGVCHSAGATNPASPCKKCDPNARFDGWSPNRDPDMAGLACQLDRVAAATRGLACPSALLHTVVTRVARLQRLAIRLAAASPPRARRLESRLERRIATLSRILDAAAQRGRCVTTTVADELQVLRHQLQAVHGARA